MWQHIKLSEQLRPRDSLACCWDVKQPTVTCLEACMRCGVSSMCVIMCGLCCAYNVFQDAWLCDNIYVTSRCREHALRTWPCVNYATLELFRCIAMWPSMFMCNPEGQQDAGLIVRGHDHVTYSTLLMCFQMQDRVAVFMCNLKASKMHYISS